MVTERENAADLLGLLVDSVTEYAIFMLDTGGSVVTWNDGAQRIKGYQAEEVIGQHFRVFYPEPDRSNGAPETALEEAAAKGTFKEQSWRVRKDGSRFLADVVITALRDSEGRLTGFAKVTRDVSERLQAVSDHLELEAMARRDRIGAELADTVVRSLFGASIELLGVASLVKNEPAHARLMAVIDELDKTLRQVRAVILDL